MNLRTVIKLRLLRCRNLLLCIVGSDSSSFLWAILLPEVGASLLSFGLDTGVEGYWPDKRKIPSTPPPTAIRKHKDWRATRFSYLLRLPALGNSRARVSRNISYFGSPEWHRKTAGKLLENGLKKFQKTWSRKRSNNHEKRNFCKHH